MADNAVVFCTDTAGFPYASLAAMQMAKLSVGKNIDVLICGPDALELPDALTVLGVKSRALGLPPEAQTMIEGGAGFLPPTAYLRLFLPQTLDGEYRRILYLDIDALAVRGDLNRLFACDLGGAPLAAVRDMHQWRRLTNPVFEFEANGLPGHPYFNSGVLLIDIAAWLSTDLTAAVFEQAGKGLTLYTQDQGLMNLALAGHWAELHPTWNWHAMRGDHPLRKSIRPNVLHFAGREKPWHVDGREKAYNREYVAAYASYLARHFPDHPRPDPSQVRARQGFLQFWERPMERLRLRTYLKRFKSRYVPVPAKSDLPPDLKRR